MRLDEWQKYIEAQFLDDIGTIEERLPEQPPIGVIPEQSSADVQDQGHISQSPQIETPAATVGESMAIVVDRPIDRFTTLDASESIAADSLTNGVAEALPSLPTHCEPIAVSFEPHFNARIADFGALPEFDVTIPAFDSYLPPSHRGARSDSSDEYVRSCPTLPPRPESERSPNTVDAPADTNRGLPESQSSLPCDEAAQSLAGVAPTELPPPPLRRASHSRARHARNVRPEHVPSGLSASELWAKVPKHVQTLLALDRLDEEQEIAQFSYKRPFQEKRHELIERILDPILSLEDTARLLNVCPTTVRRYTNKGILTYYRKEPDRSTRNDLISDDEQIDGAERSQSKETRQRRFRLSDILAFLETQQAALEADRQAEEKRTGQARKRRPHNDDRSDFA